MNVPPGAQVELSRLAGDLRTESADLARLHAAAAIVERSIPGCDSVSIALLVEDVALTGSSTSRLALEADLVQYRTEEGPCLAAAWTGSPVRIDVLAEEERFTHFAQEALALGVESVLSLPLVSGDICVGSANLYSTRSRAFEGTSTAALAPMLDYASEVIAQSELYAMSTDAIERLVEVLEETHLVDLALGLLVRIRRIGADEAWRHLHETATAHGSLVGSARQIIATLQPEERRP